jgi:ribosomal protein L14E/L6E/L27E
VDKNKKIFFVKPIDKRLYLCYNTDRKGEENPSRKEIKIMANNERIAQIERELFVMEFKEHWTEKDWARRAELNKELAELRG